jgi:hypothetical protein
MTAYPGGSGYLVLLNDLRQYFRVASSAAPKAPADNASNVTNTLPGPALPAACKTALAAAIRKLPRLQPSMQSGRCETVRIFLPLVPKSTK